MNKKKKIVILLVIVAIVIALAIIYFTTPLKYRFQLNGQYINCMPTVDGSKEQAELCRYAESINYKNIAY